MKAALSLHLQSSWPRLYAWLSSYRFLRSFRFYQQCKARFKEQQIDLASELYKEDSIEVLSGPFKGMKYYNKVVWGPIAPRWLGSYESELHNIVIDIVDYRYAKIVNVGAAEGYYTVGLARLCPDSEVLSYDIDPLARLRQKQLLKLNSVSNVSIRKLCSHSELSANVNDRSIVICDIEGFEKQLLDPKKCPELLSCDMLVELHAFEGESVEDMKTLMVKRFASTHTIYVVPVSERSAQALQEEVPQLSTVGAKLLSDALDEFRGSDQLWVWMLRK